MEIGTSQRLSIFGGVRFHRQNEKVTRLTACGDIRGSETIATGKTVRF